MVAAETFGLKYEEAIRGTIATRHEAGRIRPVPLPSPSGAFASTRLPWVFPLVLDTHVLGTDLARRARCGRTILVSGAISGVLRLFAPHHVVAEVRQHMAVWAALAERSVAEVEVLWRTEYLPLIRVVDGAAVPLYPDEWARVQILADDEIGDPDDVPTAVLGLLLDAPVLSHDEKLLRAVYGHDFDCKAHGEWLKALRAGGDLGPLGEFISAGYLLSAGVAVGVYSLVVKLVELIGWPLTLMLAGAGAAGFHFFASPETKAKVAQGSKTAALEGWELLQALLATSGQAIGEIEGLRPRSAPLREGSYDPAAMLRRVALYTVARARPSSVSAEQLTEMLRGLAVPHGEKKLREVLRSTPAFEEVYRGRFQVGQALVRQAAAPLAGAA
jgi:predicted nucleic acid-binding protein